ncbi:MAG TPA: ATP-dependent zinc metalloprotease FtsH [Thermoleophilaceae bacterium]|nr:ATP-dependent zinc metalloprotease FtsH [Thermoleophilaceae bacterium]
MAEDSENRLRRPDPRTPLPRAPQEGSGPSWRVDPAPDGRGKPPEKKPMLPFSVRRFVTILALLLFVNWLFVALFAPAEERDRIPYTPVFVEQVERGNVKEISARGDTVQGEFKREVKKAKKFETEVPTFADDQQLSRLLQDQDVTVNAKPPSDRSLLQTLLFSFGPTLLLVALFIFLARRATQGAGAGGMLGQFGRSKARRAEGGEDTRVSFKDVAGIDEARDELTEIVDFLRTPDKYLKLGARIPRGVLLSGQPGTGKTLLAKAVAGEAGVPFFSISASEFIEAIVGVGASRVRDLFQQAKDAAPAIIFIDELDAIGRSRSGGGGFSSGGHDEREQTLNQILTEMDGFETGDGVVVLAATNRPEILDKALLRAGRFDRRVAVQSPDKHGRQRILEVHTRSVPLDDDVDLQALAQSTPGMVGADLANVVNEAALLAARRGRDKVGQADLTDAVEKIILGTESKMVQSEEDRRRIAYHEAGHAIIGMLTPGADPVRKVSIVPRGQALGVTLSAPDADVFNLSEGYLKGKIKVALGGRVAEELAFGTITTGAESDIQQATGIAQGMVGRWGMSDEVGFVAVQPMDGTGPLMPGVGQVSEATQRLVDHEVRRIIDEAQDDVRRLLDREREKLDSLAETLLSEETLDELDAYRAAGIDRVAAPV